MTITYKGIFRGSVRRLEKITNPLIRESSRNLTKDLRNQKRKIAKDNNMMTDL
jgi:hypothetical protein